MGPNVERLRKCRSIVEISNVVDTISKSTREAVQALHKSTSRSTKGIRLRVSLNAGSDQAIKLTQGRRGQKIVQDGATLSDLRGVKLAKFVPPNKATLAKHAEMLHKLHGNEMDLNAAEGMLLHSFNSGSAQRSVLAAIKALKKETQAGLDKAFSVLNNVGINHIPPEMTTVVKEMGKYVETHIPKTQYTEFHDDMDYVVPATTDGKGDEFQFCHYTQLKNLKNDKGYVFENFFFILTGVVNTLGIMRFYVNAFPNFIAPGHYPLGRAVVDVKGIETRLHLLMMRNDIDTEFESRPLALTPQDLKAKGFTAVPGVKNVEVKNNVLTVDMGKGVTPDQINKMLGSIIPLLHFHAGGKTNVVNKPRVVKGVTYLDFKLTPKRKVDPTDQQFGTDSARLEELQDVLGLDDQKMAVIKKALRPYY